MSQLFDVLIAGGGIVGLTASLALAKHGFTVAVMDAGSLTMNELLPNGRVYAINQASQALLEQLNAWPGAECLSPYQRMHVWDAQSKACIDFDARTIATSNLGHILEENVLKQALFQEISRQPNVHLFPHSPIEDIQNDDPSIKISNSNRQLKGRLFMVADGANSPSRQKLKVELTTWSYHQHAIAALVTTEKSHFATAFQVFNPDGPLAFLPMMDKNQCSIVWSTDSERSRQLMALDDAAFNQELTQAFAKRLGQIQIISSRQQFPLQMRHVKQYTGNRWLLMGDCAHTIHPLAGLGLNIGLADVRSWMNCLQASPRRKSSQPIFSNKQLAAYQRERKQAVWQMIWLMEGLKRLFSHSFGPIIPLRGLGLSVCNHIMPLKRLLIQQATGIH